MRLPHHRRIRCRYTATRLVQTPKGCIKGAIVGGVAGHMARHGKSGAVAGCVIGHHEANKTNVSPPRFRNNRLLLRAANRKSHFRGGVLARRC